ncbi:MAG TPA: ice-binding family protein, partial [Ilumatobacteraceae bacterium]|nr:ice-binding family protein [Ilumatobacteraceae bacterium]
ANPCNVYWQVGSSATLGTNSVFVGTVLALTSVAATTGATVQGRLLARNGEVTLDNNVITVPNCASAPPDTATTTTVSATPTTVVPTPNLPETGGANSFTVLAALLAVGIGGGLVLLAARRSPSAPRRG